MRPASVFIALVVVSLSAAPLPAGSDAPRSMIAARQRFFGERNVDPASGVVRRDRVIMSWFSVASYAASIKGHVVLLDAWVARGSHSGYVPTSPKEVAALRPEYIFIGHGDFDHAADTARIAKLSGAKVVGTPEHCDSVRQQAGEKVPCVRVGPREAPPGHVKRLDIIPGVDITAVQHIHSSVESPELDGGRLPCPPQWNPQDTAEHPPAPQHVEQLLRHLPDARGGNVLYQFRVGDFSFVHHDTTGKIDTDAPQVVDILKSLPETDVQFGAVLAFGQVTNCMRSLGIYIRALRPKVYAATHHDNFTYAIGANAENLEPYVREELARIPRRSRPKLLYTYDPQDYINPDPFTFNPRARAWR